MDSCEKNKWLSHHIPSRVRAALARTQALESCLQGRTIQNNGDRFRTVCDEDAIQQGRLAAVRWLIEYLGIKESKGRPVRCKPEKNRFDIYADSHGGCLIEINNPDAPFLAKTWTACSQATGHPTHGSNHQDVSPETIGKAVQIIMRHLDETLYKGCGSIAEHLLE